MRPRILLVNPPIHDFAAYDFWLRPYGLLGVAGKLRGRADFRLFDFLDRCHSFVAGRKDLEPDQWGRGRFYEQRIARPVPLAGIPRHFRRFGLPRPIFREYLRQAGPFDYILVQTMMTYWYPGVAEVVEDARSAWPKARIVLGGSYATLCAEHARGFGPDLLVTGADLRPLWTFLGTDPDVSQPPLWEGYHDLDVGVLKLSDGCPFQCSYCSTPHVYGRFRPRPPEQAPTELEWLVTRGAGNVAFYDDALLFDAQSVLGPFLRWVIERGFRVNFHTPNGLNARFLTGDLADLMVRAGFRTFYLGFESASRRWQQETGGKVFSQELEEAVRYLRSAGADPNQITAYQILGHPDSDVQELEKSMRYVCRLGIRGMLADFSPIPVTPDGASCRRWVDLDEPLMHNKTAFPIIRLGFEEVNRLKELQRALNRCVAAR